MYVQWKCLKGDKQKERMSEQRAQQRAPSSSHLFSKVLEEVFRSAQNKRTTKHKAHFTACGPQLAFIQMRWSQVRNEPFTAVANLRNLAGHQHFEG